jgi:molecular chaperone GrpE (heat shock protein)
MSTKPMFDEFAASAQAEKYWSDIKEESSLWGFIDGARWQFTQLQSEIEKERSITNDALAEIAELREALDCAKEVIKKFAQEPLIAKLQAEIKSLNHVIDGYISTEGR